MVFGLAVVGAESRGWFDKLTTKRKCTVSTQTGTGEIMGTGDGDGYHYSFSILTFCCFISRSSYRQRVNTIGNKVMIAN